MKTLDIGRIKDYLFSREDLIAAYLFGSRASKIPRPESDIDIAVLLSSKVKIKDYGFIKLNIITDLIELLSFDKVDIVILNIAPPLLSHEVIKKGTLLFLKDEKKYLEYAVKATMRYLDTIYLRRVQDKILHEKIRSGDFGYFKGSHKYSIEKVRKGASDTSPVG
ncbi:MAG TPA: nucleotidyltransferase domain-containing protein [Nitrospirae bacterium]|nr:nucleotidyltransferase domain protein [bacterium BMS3Abin10]GBE38908.1 nucleotidyltransferase domain protein [bacterium BMS3Bbin08]HDK82541.1 nucleotidyltransferase domain-containing protein [Nitrospirota bacterium]